MKSAFWGQTYAYPTPNAGTRRIGVTTGFGGAWVVVWFNDCEKQVRVKTTNLPELQPREYADVEPFARALQARLEVWAEKRGLREWGAA